MVLPPTAGVVIGGLTSSFACAAVGFVMLLNSWERSRAWPDVVHEAQREALPAAGLVFLLLAVLAVVPGLWMREEGKRRAAAMMLPGVAACWLALAWGACGVLSSVALHLSLHNIRGRSLHQPSTVQALGACVLPLAGVVMWFGCGLWSNGRVAGLLASRQGLCTACGYDLRGTLAAGRAACPECGQPISEPGRPGPGSGSGPRPG